MIPGEFLERLFRLTSLGVEVRIQPVGYTNTEMDILFVYKNTYSGMVHQFNMRIRQEDLLDTVGLSHIDGMFADCERAITRIAK